MMRLYSIAQARCSLVCEGLAAIHLRLLLFFKTARRGGKNDRAPFCYLKGEKVAFSRSRLCQKRGRRYQDCIKTDVEKRQNGKEPEGAMGRRMHCSAEMRKENIPSGCVEPASRQQVFVNQEHQ
jgi:hypothetical protein